jgi:hypothetical protein
MPRIRLAWNRAVEALVLVKFGQELGSDSRLARAIHDAIEILLTITR